MTRPRHTSWGVYTLAVLACLIYVGGFLLFAHIITIIFPT